MHYITDRNSFSLTKPPDWWLAGMAAFDPDLVLMPSRFRAVHMLTRRVKYSRGLGPLGIGHVLDADTQMFIEYGVVPVCWIDCANWSMGALTGMLDGLRARDTYEFDGPLDESDQKRAMFEGETKATKAVDARDAAREAKIAAENHDNVYNATGDAWRYRQHLTGERVLSAGPATAEPDNTAAPSGASAT